MATDSSKIILGLPSLPNDSLSPQLYNELVLIYKAIRNAVDGMTRLSGIDAPEDSEWSQLPPSATILSGNLTRMYVKAQIAISAGQMVSLMDDGGELKVRLANASSPGTLAHGIANTSGAAGQYIEMQWLRASVQSIGGLTLGVLYYLSTTAGAIQNLPPVAGGTIQQPIGVAVGSSTLLMDIPLSFKIN